VTDDRPLASGDGHDLPGLVDERVPGVAAVVDDIVEGFKVEFSHWLDASKRPETALVFFCLIAEMF